MEKKKEYFCTGPRAKSKVALHSYDPTQDYNRDGKLKPAPKA